jgi:hypothetical protein
MKLKTYNVIILLLILSSCSTSKDKFNALNDYIKLEIKDTTKNIIVVKEKVSPNKTIEIFNTSQIIALDSKKSGSLDTTLYQEKQWKHMKKKYENIHLTKKDNSLEDKYWTKEDFTYRKIILEGIKGLPGDYLFYKYLSNLNIYVYYFSEPIYYKDRKHLVFTVYQSDRIGGYGGGSSIFLVVMKKEKGKWLLTHIAKPERHT